MTIVRVGLAAIPARIEPLQEVIASLLPQADEIYVSLNGFQEIPPYLVHRKIHPILAENLGDYQKFDFLEGFNGYYITCDDDIVYGPGFIDSIVEAIEHYDRRVVVGWHGSVLKSPFKDYYDAASRAVYTFRSNIPADKFVDVLGTGCMGFHTDTIRPTRALFERPSMADVYFAKLAREQSVPLVLIAHPASILSPIETESSISGDSISQVDSALNVRSSVNELAASLLRLPYSVDAVPIDRRPLRIGIVGRFSVGRWQKGGIFKSCALISKMIQDVGWMSVDVEIDDSLTNIKEKILSMGSQSRLDVLLIYTGDQSAQDYYAVPQIVDWALEAELPVAVNLSIDLDGTRASEIRSFINSRMRDPNLFVMAFTREISTDPSHIDFKDRMIVMPKTIQSIPSLSDTPFSQRSDIFLGDIAKLSDSRLSPDPLPYLNALRDKMPTVKFYCVQQYSSKNEANHDLSKLIEVIPYQSNVLDLFGRFRLYVHLQRFCTFEMLPIEAMSSGLPVGYIDMPQSLNEYIGMAGIRFVDPEDFATKASHIYKSPQVWEAFSRSGIHKAHSIDTRFLSGAMSLAILEMVGRASKGH